MHLPNPAARRYSAEPREKKVLAHLFVPSHRKLPVCGVMWEGDIYHTLLIVVGRTSALGNEKSQYLAIVFGGGSDIHLK